MEHTDTRRIKRDQYGYPGTDPTMVEVGSDGLRAMVSRDASPVEASLNAMHEQISIVETRLEQMAQFLEFVLRPDHNTINVGVGNLAVGDADFPQPACSQLVTRIDFATAKLRNLERRMDVLIDRIEL